MVQDLIHVAIRRAGSEEKLGKALGYSQHAVWKAKTVGRVSPKMALRLDEWSRGFISKHELRPDIFGDAPAPGQAA